MSSLQDQITREILSEKKQRSLEDWIRRLKTTAKISVNEKLLMNEGPEHPQK
jgi:hypothetical protein